MFRIREIEKSSGMDVWPGEKESSDVEVNIRGFERRYTHFQGAPNYDESFGGLFAGCDVSLEFIRDLGAGEDVFETSFNTIVGVDVSEYSNASIEGSSHDL
jgi:hypothetical protein